MYPESYHSVALGYSVDNDFKAIFTGYLVCQIGGIANGSGRHIWDLERENAERALQVR